MKPIYEVSAQGRWLRFILGLVALTGFFGFFASGWIPPGPVGEVLRSNHRQNIDASPLFYSDLENMPQIEADVRALREAAESASSRRDPGD